MNKTHFYTETHTHALTVTKLEYYSLSVATFSRQVQSVLTAHTAAVNNNYQSAAGTQLTACVCVCCSDKVK